MPLLLLFKQQTLCCLMRWVLEWGVFRFNRKAVLGFAVVYIALLHLFYFLFGLLFNSVVM